MKQNLLRMIPMFALGCVILVFVAALIRSQLIDSREGVSYFHFLYESTFGPTSAVLTLFSSMICFKTARSFAGGLIGKGLMNFTIGLVLLTVGMFAFGIHGWGLLGGEEMRYILRSSVFLAAFFMFAGSYVIANGLMGGSK